MHSNIASSVSVSVNKPALYLPVSFLPPDGCPDLCNGNGRCTLGQNSWQCVCQTGWRGPGCNVAMETSCADNKDNEGGEQKSSNSPSLKTRGLSILSSWVILLQKEFGCHYHQVLLFPSFETNRAERSGLAECTSVRVSLQPMAFQGCWVQTAGTELLPAGSWHTCIAEQLTMPVCTSIAADLAG